LTRVTIYDVDGLVQSYAKETSTDFKALQRRYKRITSGKRFAAAFPRYHGGWGVPLVKSSGGGSYAYLSGHHSKGHCITLGSNRSEAVMLHEIAHFVEYRHPQVYGKHDGHGAGFAAALLDVVRIAQGAEAEKALRHLYSALGIKVHRNGRVGRVRAPGAAPEKAQAEIDRILGYRAKAADKRARARAMARAAIAEGPLEGGSRWRPMFATDCDCEGTASVWEDRTTRTTVVWSVRCERCNFFEQVALPREPKMVAAR
jgi:hypothetical protein